MITTVTEREDRYPVSGLFSTMSELKTRRVDTLVSNHDQPLGGGQAQERGGPSSSDEKEGEHSISDVWRDSVRDSEFMRPPSWGRDREFSVTQSITDQDSNESIESQVGHLRQPVSTKDALQSPVSSGEWSIPEKTKPPSKPMNAADIGYFGRIGRTLVGRYQIEELIGKGGMGCVYRAIQTTLNRPVAIKILNPEFQQRDAQFSRRFFLEASATARLMHPNTVTVYDYGEAENGELFIVMEYLKGRPLSRVLATEGALRPLRAVHISMQICRALREAHAKGIVHRDLKPGNILVLDDSLDGDFVKVLDFGLAKLSAGSEIKGVADGLNDDELTQSGMFLGSPKYMAPEQIESGKIGPCTDIYSLGVVMYHMIAGRPPFVGSSGIDTLYKHLNQPPLSFESLGLSVPPELDEVVQICLRKQKHERYPSMTHLLGTMKDIYQDMSGVSFSEPSLTLAPVTQVHLSARFSPSSSKHRLRESAHGEALLASGSVPKASWVYTLVVVLVALLGITGGGLGVMVYMDLISIGQTTALREPAAVHLDVISHPPGAEVFYRGAKIGQAPFRFQVHREPEGRRLETFVFRAPGYKEAVVDFSYC